MDSRKQLEEEIVAEFDILKGMSIGTEEYKLTVDGITKLLDRLTEMDKQNREREDKKREYEDKLKQAREDRIFRIFEAVMKVAGLAVPNILLVWGVLKSLKFEIDGTVTTLAGRGLVGRLFRGK